MFKWNENTIEWFTRASISSEFHKKLSLIIKDIIKTDSTILDIGAGLGFLDRELSKYAKKINLVENDSEAFNFLSNHTMPNLDLYNMSWEDYKEKNYENCDYLLLSFFSRMDREDNLESLLSLCKDSIIYIRNENHAGNDNLIKYLNTKDVTYSFTHYDLDFSQPLRENEIELFFESYYKRKDKNELLKKIVKKDDAYLYKNNKSISIFVIQKQKF